MRPKSAIRSLEDKAGRLARVQENIVSHSQLLAVGFGARQVSHRVQQGRWRRIHRGVYALGPAPLSQRGVWIAAVLACGPGAVLSHLSAAALWKIKPFQAAVSHVTAPSGAGRQRRRGLVIHRVPALSAKDVTIWRRIPVTTPARTLFDLATALTLRELERAFDEADYLKLLKLDAIHALLVAHPGRRGNANLKRVLTHHDIGSSRTASWLEETFLAACDRQGLPRPEVNGRNDQDKVDFLWRDARFIVETDGGRSHRTRYAFNEDPARGVRQALTGHQTIRFTYDQIDRDADACARDAGTVLRRRLAVSRP